METILLAIRGAAEQGLMWAVAALGIYVTFRLLNIADMTVDGSFATGGCVAAVCLSNGVNPVIATIMAALAGFLCGLATGLLHTRGHIPAILAGILTQLGLYSIDLRIMGRSNMPLLKLQSVFDQFAGFLGLSKDNSTLILGLLFSVIIISLMYWFFGTSIGSAIRATGSNEQMVRSLACSTDLTKIIGLMIGNGLVALSGALVSQAQGYADVKMGSGCIVIGLASIIIGEALVPKSSPFWAKLAGLAGGAIIYRIIVALVLQMGLSTDDLKLLTAVLVGLALAIPAIFKNWQQKQTYLQTLKGDRRNAGNR